MSQPRRTPPAFVVLLLLIASVASVACTSPGRIDQATAIRIATDSFASGQGPVGTVSNVTIDAVTSGVDAGRPAWKVSISGDVTDAGLYVHAENGDVRVFAQGRPTSRKTWGGLRQIFSARLIGGGLGRVGLDRRSGEREMGRWGR